MSHRPRRSRRPLVAAALVPGLALAFGAALGPAASAAPSTSTTASASTDASGLTSQNLATAGAGSPYYRIPALATTTQGTLIAAYDARPTLGDLPNHIKMVIRRSTDDGRTWQTQQVVREDPAPHGYGDPSLVVDHDTGRIFLFYAAGMNQGYFGSHTGTDESDPDVLQADYSYSDDDGRTWQHRRITHEIKEPQWGGMFASSGKGIQIKRGKYAGRLVQQYAVRYQGGNWAMSVYSDDHGQTWHHGKLVGPGMDENKVVELADGRLMLNSRSASGYRKVAYSTDGGETWSQPVDDHQLPDPSDNGSILRYNRNAGPNSPEAHKLLFSNNESQSARENLVVKQSCDDGRTWPIRKVVEPGFAAYSTLERLPNGNFGLLWESNGYRNITFSSFSPDWLGGVCAPLHVAVP
ncbi:MAG TPA: sialidase family protein, partial [Segeticoccus sp.]|uniref:sialidase family protein n=1 Tax=Segeticoccus sp. TaxID=2706531 RepID=UPI002D7F8E51